MRHFVTALLLASALAFGQSQSDDEDPNTILVHPGETLYAMFERDGTNLKLVRVSPQKDQRAQLVIAMKPYSGDTGIVLRVENKFDKDVAYKAEMRILSRNKSKETSVLPVPAGKMSFEQWPYPLEELALYAFELKGP